jgi:hypothetical protein
MITDMNARVAMAQKLSIPQLQQAIKNGTVPAYVGVPLLQDKMRQQQQMAMAQQGQQQQQPPIAEQIMAEASRGGVDQLPSNLPIQNEEDEEGYAGGGIIAFSDRGRVIDPARRSLSQDNIVTQLNERMGFQPYAGRTIYGRPEDVPKEITTQDILKTIDAQNPADYEYTAAQGAKNFIESVEEDKVANRRAADAELERIIAEKNRESARVASADIPQEPTLVRGSLTEGLTPASIRASEDQLPKAIAALPGAAGTPRAGTPAGGTPRAAAPAAEAAPAPMSALDQYAAMLMDERKGIAKDRQQAKAMALLQTGLGIAGGTSPNPFANISQGALQGTQAYQQEMRGIRKEDSDRLKQLMSLGIGKEKLALEAKKLGITEKRFDQMYDLETAKLGVMGGQRADSRAQAEELRRLSVAQGLFSTLRKDQLMSGLSDEELWSRAQRMAGQAGTTPVASSGSTVMGSYVPGKGYIPNK